MLKRERIDECRNTPAKRGKCFSFKQIRLIAESINQHVNIGLHLVMEVHL
jgi:hypothetical protein